MKQERRRHLYNSFYNKLAGELAQELDAYSLVGMKKPEEPRFVHPRELFKNIEISEDMKKYIKEQDALGIPSKDLIGDWVYSNTSDQNDQGMELTGDLLNAIRAAIAKDEGDMEKYQTLRNLKNAPSIEEENRGRTSNKFNSQGVKVEDRYIDIITYSCLDIVHRLGNKAVGKKLVMPTKLGDKPITISPKIVQKAEEAITWLLSTFNTTNLPDAINRIKIQNKHLGNLLRYRKVAGPIRANFNPMEALTHHIASIIDKASVSNRSAELNDFYIKIAEEDYTSQIDDPEYGVQCDTEEECLHAFVADPKKETFSRLVDVVSAEVDGKDPIDKILILAHREGINWITEENVQFLYELYSV